MLNIIKQFLDHHFAPLAPHLSSEEQLRVASVALFLEMIEMDDKGEAKERDLILSLVQKSFSLTAEQAEALIAMAEQDRKQATDYFQYTSLINKLCSLEQKIQLIESLWRIALVDGQLDPEEEYLVRKLAELLYVPHVDFIMTKIRVNHNL
ncbi:TerB family tellurite resistance protein [Methylomicrobium sp. Wu6]|uniref:tellurite resistance TerB family protein n=1 Tax=Methylomicrobium sp. Wu6 TaxID=3107928 RepID=UPI002DD6202E|nr:TerB family tellurite resistance protein [Methylomicrobium sp. Wu6]MEC4749073.1 TerB family tellurite resistance protein [Methylomicrobium sp. Wu6]